MKTIYDVRRKNARDLAESVGGVSDFAAQIDRAQTQVSRLIGFKRTTGKNQNIGDGMARHIEQCFEKPTGWLDVQHDTDEKSANSSQMTGENISPAPEMQHAMAPEISWIRAGAFSEAYVEIDPEAVDWYPMPPGAGERTFVLRVVGESMMPEYPPNRLIYVDPDRTPVSGDDVVASMTETGEATFKRYIEEPGSGKMLKALNPAWEPQYVKINGNCHIVGEMMANDLLSPALRATSTPS